MSAERALMERMRIAKEAFDLLKKYRLLSTAHLFARLSDSDAERIINALRTYRNFTLEGIRIIEK